MSPFPVVLLALALLAGLAAAIAPAGVLALVAKSMFVLLLVSSLIAAWIDHAHDASSRRLRNWRPTLRSNRRQYP